MNPLRISTITGTAILNTNINLQELYSILDVNDIIHYIEYGCDNYKGYSKKLEKKKRNKLKKKVFYNQITTHIYHINKIINVKIFNNGHIQMTGLKDIEHTRKVLNLLLQEIMKVLPEDNKVYDISQEIYPPTIVSTNTALINSDFDVGFEIDREVLHREILAAGYYSTYEPCIYPGVNIKYFYNPLCNKVPGICSCSGKCNGKGNDGQCKKLTIAVFKSGKVIITGGNSLNQLDITYNFINNYLSDKKDIIKI